MHLIITSAVALVGALIVYVVQLSIYRLYFHPFAKYPGPFLARISWLYSFYHAWIGDTGIAQFQSHEKYGPIVRYTPDNLLFSDPHSSKDIYGAAKNFWKGKAYDPMNAQPGVYNIAFTPHKREHARRRRIMSQGFSDRAMKDAQIHVKEHVDKLCQLLLSHPVGSDKWTEPVNMEDPMFWFGMDTTTDLVFGESYNMLEQPDYRAFAKIMQSTLRRNSLVHQVPHIFKPGIGKYLDFGTWFLPNMTQKMMEYMMVGGATAMKRIQSPPKDAAVRKDVLSYLIGAKDPETGTAFTPEDVITEAMVLLLAGGDTTSMGLRVLFFYLARNKEAYNKLAAEVRSTFDSAEEIQLGEKMDSCKYLHACIDEGLRLFTGSAFWRDAGEGGAPVLNEFIPEGLTAGASQYVLSRDANIFPQPFAFKPERWIPGGKYSAEQIKMVRMTSTTFSIGPRSCVAKNLAMTMLWLVTASIIWRMDFKKAEGEAGKVGEGRPGLGNGRENPGEFQLYGSFTLHAEGPVLQFKTRV